MEGQLLQPKNGVLSLVFSSGLYPEKISMNENNLGELCQKVSSLEDSGAPSRL